MGLLLEVEGCQQPQLGLGRSALLGFCRYPPREWWYQWVPVEMVGRDVGDPDLCSKSQTGLQSWRFSCTSGLLVGTRGVVTLLRVGAMRKIGHGLQRWSLPQEQREKRFLPLLDLSRAPRWTGKYGWDGLEKLIGDLCLLQKCFRERAECSELANASVKGQEGWRAWGGAPSQGVPPCQQRHDALQLPFPRCLLSLSSREPPR